NVLRRSVGYNTSSVQGYESAWLGRWTQPDNESNNGDSSDLIRPEEKSPDQKVLPFPMFKVSQTRDSTKSDVGSSLKSVVANRMPWMKAHGDKEKLSSSIRINFPVQEKTT
ncbi:hypothetical protein HID58_013532, partial [Brassica napus]